MKLANFKYVEYEGLEREWRLAPASFGSINLLVGKNASGKSRILKVIAGLTRVLSGKQTLLYLSGAFEAYLEKSPDVGYLYEVSMTDREVTRELLKSGKDNLLYREGESPGTIRPATSTGIQDIPFMVKRNQLALPTKRDALQYPAVEEVAAWADGSDYYEFAATPIIFLHLFQTPSDDHILRRDFQHREVIWLVLQSALSKFGDAFKNAVMSDMGEIGYPINDIGTGPLSDIQGSPAPFGIWVQELDLQCKTEQSQMSQGMLRALAALIRMNLAIFSERPTLVLLDDVGEGLDYDRSVGLIKILIRKASEGAFQLIMATNDRFVMNEVPLKYWSVVIRRGSMVSLKNYDNSRNEFDKFEKLGLNNFDYFVSQTNRS